MKIFLTTVLLVLVQLSEAQIPFNYEGHRHFDLSVNPGYGSDWDFYMEKDGTYRTTIRESSNVPFQRDVSISENPDFVQFDTLSNGIGTTHHYLFRTHNPEDLTAYTNLKVQARNIPINGIAIQPDYFGAFFEDDYVLMQLNMGTGSKAVVNDTMAIFSDTDPWLRNVIIGLDGAEGVVHRRDILYKQNNFVPSWVNQTGGELANYRLSGGSYISDYRFRDTVFVIEYGDTSLYYHPEWRTVLTATAPEGTLHQKVVDEDYNNFSVLWSFMQEGQIFRVLGIGGTIDISAGSTPYMHTSQPDTYETILAAYSSDGNVLWTSMLTRFESYHESATLHIEHNGHIIDGHVAMLTGGSMPSLSGEATGLFECLANSEVVDSGVVEDGSNPFVNNYIPGYFHSIDLESGMCNRVHRLRFNPIEDGYSTSIVSWRMNSLLPDGKVGINIPLHAVDIPVHCIFDKLYPSPQPLVNVESEGIGSPLRLLTFDPLGDDPVQLFQVGFTVISPNPAMRFGAAKTADGIYVLSGNMNRAFTLHFENEDVVFSGGTPRRAFALLATEQQLSSSADSWQATGFIVYPNPTMDDLRILGMDGSFVYQIFDLQGRKVRGGEMRGSQAVTLHALQRGSYLIRIVPREGEAQVLRFVKL